MLQLGAPGSGEGLKAAAPPHIQWRQKPWAQGFEGACRGRFAEMSKRGPWHTLFVAHPVGSSELCLGGYSPFVTHANSTVEMITAAVRLLYAQGRPLPHFERLRIDMDDFDRYCSNLAYSKRCAGKWSRAIPDYVMLRWPEEHPGKGIFTEIVEGVRAAGRRLPEMQRCGFAGTPTSEQRKAMFAQARSLRGLFEIRNVLAAPWSKLDAEERAARREFGCTGPSHCPPPPRLSLEEQVARWACFVDVVGIGYSGRVPMLLHSGRPLLMVERQGLPEGKDGVWYAPQLVAWEHYIPVAADLHDLEANARWVQQHRSEAQRIADNAQRFAERFLTTEAATRHLAEQLYEAAHEEAEAEAAGFESTAAAHGQEEA